MAVNLSVTGVLLQVDHQYPVGECVEVEIEFLTQPERKTIVSGVGYIVREDDALPGAAAVQFEMSAASPSLVTTLKANKRAAAV